MTGRSANTVIGTSLEDRLLSLLALHEIGSTERQLQRLFAALTDETTAFDVAPALRNLLRDGYVSALNEPPCEHENQCLYVMASHNKTPGASKLRRASESFIVF
jgi:hypothetical protein